MNHAFVLSDKNRTWIDLNFVGKIFIIFKNEIKILIKKYPQMNLTNKKN